MKPDQIVNRLESVIGLTGAPKRLRDIVEEQLATHFGIPAIRAAEEAEKLEPVISRLIVTRMNQNDANGTIGVLSIIGSASNVVVGSCRVLPDDSAQVVKIKENRCHATPLVDAMRKLNFKQFERFGAHVLTELGAQSVKVTPHSNDQGIDFYGILNIGQLQQAPAPFFRLVHDVEVRFAGQAKHYPTKPIGPEVVRELIGAISLARHRTYSAKTDDLFEDLSLRPFNPLLAFLFTTGKLTTGAEDLSRKAGIIARSGHQLAVFLADRGVGMRRVNGEIVFDEKAFVDWLSN